jgi:hypothetical protein
MGSYLTTSVKASVTDEVTPVIPYICAKTDKTLSVDPKVSLMIKPSTLSSTFIQGKHMGLFSENFIPKGTVVLKITGDETMDIKMNDGAVDLEPILHADTSEKTYNAWMNLKKTYYDLEKIKRVVNVRMVSNGTTIAYETIQDIPAGGELIRVYGFTTWTLELFEILTNKNIVGFAQFIDYLTKNVIGDPYDDRIKRLHQALSKYGIKDIFTIDRNEYDKSMEDKSVNCVGRKLEMLYLRQF